jgi:acetolactate synthase-1/2/3 large subunit
MTVAELLVSNLREAGTRAIFGMPGGGSNLDVIDAARRAGLPFVLAQTETGGALMAAAQAEITGAPGACLCTLGPGVSSIVNGVAHGFLDRVPLVVMTDAMGADPLQFAHQWLPHDALLARITKSSDVLTAGTAGIVQAAIALASDPPRGPVHIECLAPEMSVEVDLPALAERVKRTHGAALAARQQAAEPMTVPDRMLRLVREARRPVVLAGLEARAPECVAALRALVAAHTLPVFVTYKAKGVIPDDHPSYAGLFTLGEIERPFIERADLMITVGLDAVELLPRLSPYRQPIVHCGGSIPENQFPPGERVPGPPARAFAAISADVADVEWRADEIARHRQAQRAAVMAPADGFSPGEAIAVVAEATGDSSHVTVDAGAHMFPAMALLPADVPGRILISNGLSTMGFALPTAIGAALLTPNRPTVAVTGDAGLLMCAGELRTAARERLRVIVVVMADDELSLIRIKQDRRDLPCEGVHLGEMDWPGMARAMGVRGSRATDASSLRQQLDEAMRAEGPSLIEARIDPAPYSAMLRAIRG